MYSKLKSDIKLGNVLLNSKGHAKLADFGSCLRLEKNETTLFTIASWFYMPPESFKTGVSHFSFDFWSLGVCIFEMLTGKMPFNKKEELCYYVNQLPDLNEIRLLKDSHHEISQHACNLVSKLLNIDPALRLGANENRKDFENNSFYAAISWDKLEKGEIEPPIKPRPVTIVNNRVNNSRKN